MSEWISVEDRLPRIEAGTQEEFIVTIQSNGSIRKYVASALYLNQYPLYSEYDEDADEDGNVPHSGWFDSNSNGDDANCYTEIERSGIAYGSKVTHWMPLPEPAC